MLISQFCGLQIFQRQNTLFLRRGPSAMRSVAACFAAVIVRAYFMSFLLVMPHRLDAAGWLGRRG